ncbi:MAG: CDP-alcohol phosphatidyltransferase family protein [Polyangiaceae bacterium]
MSLLDGYLKSLKPLEIEEPIDVWVHRPLAYLLALGLYPTPVSPNAVTFFSILCGLAAGGSMVCEFPHHMALGGLFIFLSAVVDCADGQLARMRRTSSAFGRMLDGVADAIVSAVIVAGGAVVVLRERSSSMLELVVFGVLVVITAVTGSFHTGGYDFYKNLFLRLTNPKYQEGEDLVTATRRRQAQTSTESWWMRRVWAIYIYYIESHDKLGRWFDPYSARRINALPPFDEGRATIYRRHAGGAMRLWRSLFGFGSMVFGFAVFTAFDALDWYVVVRGIGLNLIYFGVLRPLQQRASRNAFSAMGIDPVAIDAS